MNFTKISEFLKDTDPGAKLWYFSLAIGREIQAQQWAELIRVLLAAIPNLQ
jgi:hypothetical protein